MNTQTATISIYDASIDDNVELDVEFTYHPAFNGGYYEPSEDETISIENITFHSQECADFLCEDEEVVAEIECKVLEEMKSWD